MRSNEYRANKNHQLEREKHMKVSIKNNVLMIEIPLSTPRPSGSGKTLIVATSNGIVTTDAKVNGKAIKIGLNAFIAKD